MNTSSNFHWLTRKRLSVIGISVGIVIFSYWLSHDEAFKSLDGFSENQGQYKAQQSLQAAVERCKKEVREQVLPAILKMSIEPRATGYLEASQQYRVYVNLIIQGNERDSHFAECVVSSTDNEIEQFRLNGVATTTNLIGL